MDENKNIGLDFPILHLKSKSSPVNVCKITLYKSNETQAMMRINISRDLSTPLESFTFKYRFSSLKFDEPDSRHNWHSFVYTDSDINSKSTLTFNGNVPSKMKLEGCNAYVSEVKFADGRVISYPLSDFTDKDEFEELEKLVKKSAPKATQSNVGISNPPPKKHKMSTQKLTVLLTLLFFSIIIEAVAGTYIYNYIDTKKAAQTLMDEARWNEAYKLVLDKGYKGLLQNVCENAALYYIEEDDLESSYVYAYAAPNEFTDEIIDCAAASVVESATGEIDENAYRVAKMASDDGKFSETVHSITDILENNADYINALRVASELRGDNDRARTETNIFSNAIKYYLSEHKFEGLVTFIKELDGVTTFNVSDKEITDAIINYAKTNNDGSGLIYFSTKYPDLIDLSNTDVSVKPDDAGVRSALNVIWNLLTDAQKRTYLSRSIALDKELFVVENGTLSGTDIKNVVSVATGEFYTVALLNDGSVKLISDRYALEGNLPETKDIIGISAGEKHLVFLHSNGKVTAVGNNSYGQCDVENWSNVIEIAAGQYFTLGLCADGTVFSCGSNSAGQCDTQYYNNVVSIAAGSQTGVLLFSDGTVKLTGYRSYGLSKAETASGIVSIRAGGSTVIFKDKSGKFTLYDGTSSGNVGSVDNWQSVTDYAVGNVCIAAVDSSGRIYTSGDCVPRTDIVQ